MTQRKYFHIVAASLIGAALVAGLALPSEAQFGRTRGRSSSNNSRGPTGSSRGGPATRPTTQVAATPVTAAHPDWNYYDQMVVQQNMFMRQRRSGFSRPMSTTRPAGPSITNWVLRGTVLESADRVAFLENESSGATIRVRAGESVGGSKIVNMQSEFLEVERGGIVRTIGIGSQLSGAPAPMVRTGATGEPTPAANGGETGPSSDNVDSGPGQAIFTDEMPADGGGMGDNGPDDTATVDNGGDNAGAPAATVSPEEAILQRLRARRAEELSTSNPWSIEMTPWLGHKKGIGG